MAVTYPELSTTDPALGMTDFGVEVASCSCCNPNICKVCGHPLDHHTYQPIKPTTHPDHPWPFFYEPWVAQTTTSTHTA